MANKKISQLIRATNLSGSDLSLLVNGGLTKSVSLSTLKEFINTDDPALLFRSNWDSAYSTVNTVSANWNQGYSIANSLNTNVVSNSANWGSVFTTVRANSGSWVSNISTLSTNVVSLSTAIDGKQPSGSYAASVHTHTASDITDFNSSVSAQVRTLTGGNNGLAVLVGGFIPSTNLPSYVDDVIEYSNFDSLTSTGSTDSGKIFVTLNNNKIYRWGGSAYFEIAASPGSTDAIPEGSNNLYFTNQRAETALSTKVTALSTAIDGKQASGSYAASIHTHTTSDITGLDTKVTALSTAIDGKQASGSYAVVGHTHVTSDITGLDTKVTALSTAIDGKQASGSYAVVGHTHVTSDITGLDTKVTALSTAIDGKQASGSYAVVGHTHTASDITDFNSSVSAQVRTLTGGNNGLAVLVGGFIPSTNLPSYVDDIVEYSNFDSLTSIGSNESGKIYVTLNDNKTYRWSGSAYVLIAASPGSTDEITEGTNNLYFTNQRAETALSTKVTALSSAIDGKQASGNYTVVGHTHVTSDITGLDTKVTALSTAIDGKAPTSHNHNTSEITGLDTKISSLSSAIDGKQASGSYAASVHTHTASDITDFNSSVSAQVRTLTGGNNGLAVLVGGFIPSTNLPSYVDDIVEYSNFDSLTSIGSNESGKIYVTLNDNKTYRWSGSAYVLIAASPGSTDAIPEGSNNLYFTNQRAETALSTKVTALSSAIDGKAATSHTHITSDITGLDTKISSLSSAIDGKQSSTYVYTAADITDLTEVVQDTVSNLLSAGTGINLNYNDAVNKLEVSFTGVLSANSSSDVLRITQSGSGNALVVEDSSTPDSTPFVVNSSGYVGIGLTVPASPLHISSNSSSGTPAVKITQTGSGDCLLIEDATSDSSTFRVDQNGKILLGEMGGTSSLTTENGGEGLQIAYSGSQSSMFQYRAGANANGAVHSFAKSRVASAVGGGNGGGGPVQNGDALGSISFLGDSNAAAGTSGFVEAGLIKTVARGTFNLNSCPAAITFSTRLSTNGSSTGALSERLRIEHDGKVGIGVSAPVTTLHVSGNTFIENGSLTATNITGSVLIGIKDYTSSFTLSSNDAGSVLKLNSSSPITVSVPPSVTTSFLQGSQLIMARLGTGSVTMSAGPGVTILSLQNKLSIYSTNSIASLIYLGSDQWLLAGDLV